MIFYLTGTVYDQLIMVCD